MGHPNRNNVLFYSYFKIGGRKLNLFAAVFMVQLIYLWRFSKKKSDHNWFLGWGSKNLVRERIKGNMINWESKDESSRIHSIHLLRARLLGNYNNSDVWLPVFFIDAMLLNNFTFFFFKRQENDISWYRFPISSSKH